MTDAYQPDLFACPAEPELPLARPHPLNTRCYALDDCHEVQIALDRTHQLGMLFARVADGWQMAVSYYTPMQGRAGPVAVRSRVYPDFASARAAALARMRIIVNELQMVRILPPSLAGQLRAKLKEHEYE